MASLMIVTGPPGSGKSTVARMIANDMDRSILVEGDRFYDFLAAGAIEPWLDAAREQNDMVGDAAAAATNRFAADADTIYEGVLGPWQLLRFVAVLDLSEIDYVMLLPTVETCLERVRSRIGHEFSDPGATRHMHNQFATAMIDKRHVIDSGEGTPQDVADSITARRRSSLLRITC